jgi:hypothetical protein
MVSNTAAVPDESARHTSGDVELKLRALAELDQQIAEGR